jgi:predicted amidophosphoribosyltransferase
MQDITFECPHCQQVLEAPPDLAGQTIECPACGQPIVIPATDAVVADGMETVATDTPVEETGTLCPSCGAVIPEDAVLCVQCGYHLKLGKRMDTIIE